MLTFLYRIWMIDHLIVFRHEEWLVGDVLLNVNFVHKVNHPLPPPKLTHPTTRFLCDSSASCLYTNDNHRLKKKQRDTRARAMHWDFITWLISKHVKKLLGSVLSYKMPMHSVGCIVLNYIWTRFITCYYVFLCVFHRARRRKERKEALRDFGLQNKPVLISTSGVGQNLGLKGVGCVIIYDMPRNVEIYIKNLRSTGRFQENGRAITLFCPSQDSSMAPALSRLLEDVITRFIIIILFCS